MAAPTNWGFNANANTSKTFPIEGTNLYGVDIGGALSPKVFNLAPNVILITTAVKTDAELVDAMREFIKRHSGSFENGSAGGYKAQGSLQKAATLTTTT